jgi:hypothetical protein
VCGLCHMLQVTHHTQSSKAVKTCEHTHRGSTHGSGLGCGLHMYMYTGS